MRSDNRFKNTNMQRIVTSLLVAFVVAQNSSAERRFVGYAFDGSSIFSVGVPSSKITCQFAEHLPTSMQQRSQWCWAASISMGFAYNGYSVSQEAIVTRIKHIPIDQPGSGPEITRALSAVWTDNVGRRFKSSCTVFDPSSGGFALTTNRMLDELASEKVVVHGAAGHATLLTYVQYVQSPYLGSKPIAGLVRDPWPTLYNPSGERYLSLQEFNSIYAAVITIESL